jgi:hypothetical protein
MRGDFEIAALVHAQHGGGKQRRFLGAGFLGFEMISGARSFSISWFRLVTRPCRLQQHGRCGAAA